MIQITPIGVATENIEASINFYRRILGISRIQNLGDQYGMKVLRLESPLIDVNSVEITSFDRQVNRFHQHNQHLTLLCDVKEVLKRLEVQGIEVSIENDRYRFVDCNGLTWYLADRSMRHTILNS